MIFDTKNMIVVLGDGQTWEMLGNATIMFLTDEGMRSIEAGNYPSQLKSDGVLAVELVTADPEMKHTGEPDNLYHIEHYAAKHMGMIPARWVKDKETGKLVPIDRSNDDDTETD